MNALLPTPGGTRKAAGLLVVAALLAASGCGGPNKGAVTGRVTYRGRPVPGALILWSADTTPGTTQAVYRAAIGADGHYATCGLPDGVYTAAIIPIPDNVGRTPPGGTGAPPGVKTAALPHVDIPMRYCWPPSSGLSLEVKGGSTTKDFALTD